MGEVAEKLGLEHLNRDGFIRLIEFILGNLPPQKLHYGCQKSFDRAELVEMYPMPVFDIPLSGQKHLAHVGTTGMAELTLSPGEALYCEPYAWKQPVWDLPHELCCLVFNKEFIRLTYVELAHPLPEGERPLCRCFYHTRLPPTDTMLKLLDCLDNIGDEADSFHAAADILRAILKLVRAMLVDDHALILTKAQTTFQRVYHYLAENFGVTVSREQVARIFRLHPGYLSRLFAEQGGGSFSRALRKIRMEHAANLLRNTDLLMDKIARQCGYRSTPTFTAVFKEYYGLPPGRFRCR